MAPGNGYTVFFTGQRLPESPLATFSSSLSYAAVSMLVAVKAVVCRLSAFFMVVLGTVSVGALDKPVEEESLQDASKGHANRTRAVLKIR